MRPSPSSSLPQAIPKPDTRTFQPPEEDYFSYSPGHSSRKRVAKAKTKPKHLAPKLSQPPVQPAENNTVGAAQPSHSGLPAPSPPQSRSPPPCTRPRLLNVQGLLTPAPTAAPSPSSGSAAVGAQPGYQISPSSSQNQDPTTGDPCTSSQKSSRRPACPNALRQRPSLSPNVTDVRALEALRIACRRTPSRIAPAPLPLSERLRAKWAVIQAAEALAREIEDSVTQADSCTKLPRRKRTIKRPEPVAVAAPAA